MAVRAHRTKGWFGMGTRMTVSVILIEILLISGISSSTLHSLGQIEVVAKDGQLTSRSSPKGAIQAATRRATPHTLRQHYFNQRRDPLGAEMGGVSLTNMRDAGGFGSKVIPRSPSLFLNVPQSVIRNDSSRVGPVAPKHLAGGGSSSEERLLEGGGSTGKYPMPIRIYDDTGIAEEGSAGETTMKSSSSSTTSVSTSATKPYSNNNNNGNSRKRGNNRMEETTVKSLTSHRHHSRNTNAGRTKVEEEEEVGMGSSGDSGPTDFRMHMLGGFLKREVWTIPLLSMASLNIFLISLFEIYVLCKARGPSRRHLFLGQMLLFGLFLSSSLALIFAICPSAVGCFLGRLGVGIAYTIIFSVLMVKCIFLLSLDGGVYLPASYQACLLLFSILVQVAIDTQWVIVYPPTLEINSSGGPLWPQCGTSYAQLLLTLSYNVFLIFIVGLLSFKTRGIRENYRESTYIGVSILVTIPIWISWTVAGWILQGRHQDACVGFGLLAQSLATFLIMFTPKGRQLAAMGKEGMFLEDQEDQCSGYSPSFFHFKPSKSYKTALIGDGNVYTTLEPTISTVNPNVFFHRSDFHPGMIY